jgi:hypothetical protein
MKNNIPFNVFIPIMSVNIKAQVNTYLLKQVIIILLIKNLQNMPTRKRIGKQKEPYVL